MEITINGTIITDVNYLIALLEQLEEDNACKKCDIKLLDGCIELLMY